jgi:hypothetical protein
MNTKELLTALKAANGGASDYRAAQLLEVKPQTVYRWVKGEAYMSDDVGLRAAEMLGLDPGKVLISLHIEREKGNATSQVWKDIGRRLEMAAMPVVVGLVGYGAGAYLFNPLF